MTPEFPPNPRAELESRLAALLLGELPADEAAALRQTLAHDPDLAALHRRLSQTLDLLRETAATSAAAHAGQPAPLRLSPARRESLLASFKTIRPPELAQPQSRRISWLVPLAAAAAILLLIGYLMLPALSRAKNNPDLMRRQAMIEKLQSPGIAYRQWPGDTGDVLSGEAREKATGKSQTSPRDQAARSSPQPAQTVQIYTPAASSAESANEANLPEDQNKETVEFKLKNAQAADVAAQVNELFSTTNAAAANPFGIFGAGKGGRGGGVATAANEPIAITKSALAYNAVPDEATRSVVVTAPKDQMVEIAKDIDNMDSPPARAIQPNGYQPIYSDVTDMQVPLQDVFSSSTDSRNSPPPSGPIQRTAQAVQNGGTITSSSLGRSSTGAEFGASTSAGYVPNAQIGPITTTVAPTSGSIVYNTDVENNSNVLRALSQLDRDGRETSDDKAPVPLGLSAGGSVLTTRDLRPNTNVPVGSLAENVQANSTGFGGPQGNMGSNQYYAGFYNPGTFVPPQYATGGSGLPITKMLPPPGTATGGETPDGQTPVLPSLSAGGSVLTTRDLRPNTFGAVSAGYDNPGPFVPAQPSANPALADASEAPPAARGGGGRRGRRGGAPIAGGGIGGGGGFAGGGGGGGGGGFGGATVAGPVLDSPSVLSAQSAPVTAYPGNPGDSAALARLQARRATQSEQADQGSGTNSLALLNGVITEPQFKMEVDNNSQADGADLLGRARVSRAVTNSATASSEPDLGVQSPDSSPHSANNRFIGEYASQAPPTGVVLPPDAGTDTEQYAPQGNQSLSTVTNYIYLAQNTVEPHYQVHQQVTPSVQNSPVQTRVLHVDPTILAQRLNALPAIAANDTGVNAANGFFRDGGFGGGSGGGIGGGGTGGSLEFVTAQANNGSISAKVRQYLGSLGVNLTTNSGNLAIYNDRAGVILVRASAKDLDTISQALAELEATPPSTQEQKNPSAPVTPAAPAPKTSSFIIHPSSLLTPQPEIQTQTNPFSTFSLNVSDVSFKLAAASLQKGALPDPATIRSEEFINAFDYRDPEPAPGAPVGFAWDRAGYPFAHNRDLLRFSVKTAAVGRDTGRPLNLVLLLDKSGSMERADRVAILREALRVLAAQLQPRDTLSVVLFARTARLWADGVSGSQAAALADALDGVTPEGGTNLEEAMKLAYETALRHYLANGENRVVILTDGAANLGDVKPEDLRQKAETNRTQGIALDCFGVGWEDYNDNLLEVLSRAGGGRYGFINAPEEAATEFAGQLAGALRVAASDVKVQVEFNPSRVTSYRQIGYAKDQLTKEQFRDNTVKAAQLGVKESGNALYTVEINPQGDGPICTVHVRYRTPGTTDYYEHAWDVPYTGVAPALDQADPAIRLAATASAFSEWLAGSPYAAEVTPGQLLGYMRDIPALYGPDHRPAELAQMLQQAQSLTGQ